ncbi:MAG: hypothetical protein ACREBH_02540 [Candidatus Micrarchaeaceae archaeon]
MDKQIIVAAVFIALLAFVAMPKAQGFGEYSGFLIYNVSINSSHSEYWTLINNYNYSVNFTVIQPNLTIASSNVTPVLTFSALNGTIGPGQNFEINVTVFMPKGVAVNTTWHGYATAFASPTGNQSGAAKIQIGTAKYIQITSEPEVVIKPKTTVSTSTNTTVAQQQQSTNNNTPGYLSTVIIVVLALALVGVIAYVLGGRNKGTRKAKAKS